jgi:DNA-binding PadR family transcriptional regulator
MLPPVSRSILTYLNAELASPSARTGEAIRVALNLDRHGSLQALEALERDQFVRQRNDVYELTDQGQYAFERVSSNGAGHDETLHGARLRAVIQELAALDEHNGGVHLSDYFDLKRRYPELSAEIDAAMQVQLAQQQRRFEARMTKRQDEFELWVKGRLDQVDAELRRIRRQMVLALFLSPALMLAVLLVFLLIAR